MTTLREAILQKRAGTAFGPIEAVVRELTLEKLGELDREWPQLVSGVVDELLAKVLDEKLPQFEAALREYAPELVAQALTDAIKEQLRGPRGLPGDEAVVDLPALAACLDMNALAKLIKPIDEQALAKNLAALVHVPTTAEIEAIARSVLVAPPTLDDEEYVEEELDEPLEEEPEETPEELVDKLLKSKKKLGLSSIEGLEPLLKNIQKALRDNRKGAGEASGGGGMGNPQHESFVVTSATTSVKTRYRIAAGGFAIMSASYNDGALMRTKDYTVGTDQRTLTLNFTPDDPTAGQNNLVQVVYIRT